MADHPIKFANEDEVVYCETCNGDLDMVWVHLNEIDDEFDEEGWCESRHARHWQDNDVCGLCGGAWVLPAKDEATDAG